MGAVITKKICLVGTIAVGKTSLATRFLSGTFSSEYLPTIGVRVGSRTVDVADTQQVKLIVWDIEGADELTTTTSNYLQGASGIVYVADGTRKPTLAAIRGLREQVLKQLGARPAVLIVNKSDLSEDWEVLNSELSEFDALGIASFVASAKSGTGVEDAFSALAAALVAS